MSARATIEIVSATATTDTPTLVTATTAYIAAEAQAYIDENSGNKWVHEFVPVSDIHIAFVNKSLDDTTSIFDDTSLSFENSSQETLALVESFARVVSYKRDFNDTFTIDDLSQIDKGFYGNKGNVTFITDIIGLDHSKIESDSMTVGDVVTVTLIYLRYFDETSILTDNATQSFSKVLEDAINLDDTALVNKDVIGNKGNAFGMSDLSVASASKALEEFISFSEQTGLQFNKPLTTDAISITELVTYAIISGRVLNGLPLNTTTLN